MDWLALRFLDFNTSEVGLLLVALQYAVLLPAWVVAAVVLPGDRVAAGWWATYAAGSALGLWLIVLGMHEAHAVARAAGNVAVVAATLALQRGVWAFTGQRVWVWPHAAVLAATALLAGLAAQQVAWVPWRIAGVSMMWAAIHLWVARDVWRHVSRQSRMRWGSLHALPLAMAAVMLLVRGLRAVVSPETVVHEVEQHTVLGVGSAVTGLVAALMLQMTLVSLVVSRLVTRLERLSRHDSLTGLLNRRAMDELLMQEEQRVRRLAAAGARPHSSYLGQSASPGQAGQMVVLMIDIDHFKRLNDSLGHAAGDRALQHLASVMGAQLRNIDHLARWGGEEFLALLPATTGDEAMALAQALCDRVRSLPVVLDNTRMPLTASVGVAEWLGPTDRLDDLLSRADAALYQAKRDGRDQVCRSGGLVPLQALKTA